MACHNRRQTSVDAVRSLVDSAELAGSNLEFVIYDDGSSDGSSAALLELIPYATILYGDGSAFWAKSMARAESYALEKCSLGAEDYLIWFNDDVSLLPESMTVMSRLANEFPDSICVGAMRDANSTDITYSGYVAGGIHPLRFDMVEPTGGVETIHTFNGNFVLVPVSVARTLGGIDGGFSHALADFDYGLRAGRGNVAIRLAPVSIGTCSRNVEDPTLSLGKRWRQFVGTKGGGNFRSIRRILRRTSPATWPLYLSSTYVLWWIRELTRILGRWAPNGS
ncbi:glycosyltransferase family 2 protein [Rhodococcus opacus]|uniref:glycosyltransferase family 2 protein n=1 Tax=Rhodococcus opacus TaxID=37919 RepID=UPI00294A2490|nr:glycosyltransferase [Rhodococcus opacus]